MITVSVFEKIPLIYIIISTIFLNITAKSQREISNNMKFLTYTFNFLEPIFNPHNTFYYIYM